MKMIRLVGFVAVLLVGSMGAAQAEIGVLPGTVKKSIAVGIEVKKADKTLMFSVAKDESENVNFAGCNITLEVDFDSALWRVMGGEGEAHCGNKKFAVDGVLVADDNSVGVEVACEKQSACFAGAGDCGFGECRIGKVQAGKQIRFALTDVTMPTDEAQYDKPKLGPSKQVEPRSVEMKPMKAELPFKPMPADDTASVK